MRPNLLNAVVLTMAMSSAGVGAQTPPAGAPPPPPPPAQTVPNFDAVFESVMPPAGQPQTAQQQAAQPPAGALPPTPKAEDIDLQEVEKILGTWGSVERTLRQQERPKALVSRTVSVSLSPGAGSPSVAIPHNYVVVLEFLDNSGSPWPIRKVLTGSKDAFLVEQGLSDADTAPPAAPALPAAQPATFTPPSAQMFSRTPADPGVVATVEAPPPTPPDGSNILLISALAPYAASNVAVLLQGSSSPISIAIHATEPAANESYTDRYTMLLDGFGPYAPPIRDSSGPADTLSDVVAVLANQPPREGANLVVAQWPSQSQTLTGAPRIWRQGSTLWLRTQDTLLSPAPVAKVSRGDWTAYRLNYLPVLLLSRNGSTYQVSVR